MADLRYQFRRNWQDRFEPKKPKEKPPKMEMCHICKLSGVMAQGTERYGNAWICETHKKEVTGGKDTTRI